MSPPRREPTRGAGSRTSHSGQHCAGERLLGAPMTNARRESERAALQDGSLWNVSGAAVVVEVTCQYASGMSDTCHQIMRMFYLLYRCAGHMFYLLYRCAGHMFYLLYRCAGHMLYLLYRCAGHMLYLLYRPCLLYRCAGHMFYLLCLFCP